MIPVLFRIALDTPVGAGVGYALGIGIVAYLAWSGWRGAAASTPERATRALLFGALGLVLARLGLYYALPSQFFLGAKGEGIPLHTYGLLLASGFMAAVALGAHLAEQEWRGEEGKRKREQIYDLAFWVFAAGVGGSKLLFLIVNWSDYAGHWGEYLAHPFKLVDCLGGGLVFYGGLIGATLASYVYARIHRFDFWRLADVCIPSVSLGQCLGRLGCFSAGCCWGDIGGAGLKWGVQFPGEGLAKNLFGGPTGVASLAYQSQAVDSRWVVESTGQILHQSIPGAVRISDWVARHGHTLPVHPTQLYESLGQLALFVALMLWRPRRRFHGQIFGSWLMAYAVLRTAVELFRGDVERGTLNGLLHQLGWADLAQKVPLEAWYNFSTSQFISLCMFAFGAALLYRRGREVWFRGAAASSPAPA